MAIQQVAVKPDNIKKSGPVNPPERQPDRQSDKGDDLFSILLSMSMNSATQGVKETGLNERKIEKEPAVETGDKLENSNDKKSPSTLNPLLRGEGRIEEQSRRESTASIPPPQVEKAGGGPGEGKQWRFSDESVKSRGLTKGDENPAFDGQRTTVTEYGFSDKQLSLIETGFNLQHEILPDSMVNPRIENLDNNKLLNDNGMLVTAVNGTPVNTESNSIGSQPVYRYADQGNLIQYMSQQIIHASHVGAHTAKLRLRPAELGDLRLDISVADKNVKALIVVENEEIKKMVESSFNSLRDELKNQGLNIEQFSVEIQKDDFMDNLKSMYERHEKGSKKWAGIITEKDTGSSEHSVIMPVLFGAGVKGGLSLFA